MQMQQQQAVLASTGWPCLRPSLHCTEPAAAHREPPHSRIHQHSLTIASPAPAPAGGYTSVSFYNAWIQTGIQVLLGKVPHTERDAYYVYDKFAPLQK